MRLLSSCISRQSYGLSGACTHIELKFKRQDYGALPHNLFAIYRDIESLEREVMTDGNVGEQKYSSQSRRLMAGAGIRPSA